MAARVLTDEDLEPLSRELAALRAEVERLRSGADGVITQDDAAHRLGVSRRAIQKWLADGRLEVAQVAGVRMVRWPPRVATR